jgi:hypothetical protein
MNSEEQTSQTGDRTGSALKKTIFMLILMAAVLCAGLSSCSRKGAEVLLTVLNPRGEIEPPKILAPQPRIADLAGKRIGLYWNGKAGGDHFWNIVERLLKEKLPGTIVLRYEGAYDVGDALASRIAGEIDAFLYGVGD